MAKFRYKMQNILELKEKLETQAKMDYALQRKKLTKAQEKEQELRNFREEMREEAAVLRSEKLNVRDMRMTDRGIEGMGYRIEEQQKVVQHEEDELENKRAALEKVMKERKAQEKLREHAFRAFLQEVEAVESKAIDELTSFKYGLEARKGEKDR